MVQSRLDSETSRSCMLTEIAEALEISYILDSKHRFTIVGGMPLHIESCQPPKLTFRKRSYLVLAGLLLVVVLTVIGQQLLYSSNGVSLVDHIRVLQESGLSRTDTVSLFGMWMPHFISIIVLFWCYKKSGANFTNLFNSLQEIAESTFTKESK
jgi:hypothetical protein